MFCYSIDGNINMLCRERPAVCCTMYIQRERLKVLYCVTVLVYVRVLRRYRYALARLRGLAVLLGKKTLKIRRVCIYAEQKVVTCPALHTVKYKKITNFLFAATTIFQYIELCNSVISQIQHNPPKLFCVVLLPPA